MISRKIIRMTDLQMGDIAHFYGARFEIYAIQMHSTKDRNEADGYFLMCAYGKWLDGSIVPGYFGPTKDWYFQGNDLAGVSIEIQTLTN